MIESLESQCSDGCQVPAEIMQFWKTIRQATKHSDSAGTGY